LSDATDKEAALEAVIARCQPNAVPILEVTEVIAEITRAQLATTWTINTVYIAGKVVVVGNGRAYQCVQPGTSQSTALGANDWPAYSGALLGDGNSNPQLQWREIGTAEFNPGIAGAEFNVYDINRAAKECCLLHARKAAELVQTGETSFQQIYDHWVEQAKTFRPFRRQIALVRG
jgi:hypothetical protein